MSQGQGCWKWPPDLQEPRPLHQTECQRSPRCPWRQSRPDWETWGLVGPLGIPLQELWGPPAGELDKVNLQFLERILEWT